MANTFVVRGNSVTAYYSNGIAAPKVLGSASIVSSTASGVIGGSYIDLDQGALGQHALVYNGRNNLPTGQQMSILIRFAIQETTSTANLTYVGGIAGDHQSQLRIANGSTAVTGWAQAETGVSILANIYTAALTVNRFYDFCYLYDGSLTNGAMILYVDGAAVSTGAASAVRTAMTTTIGTLIGLGTQNAAAQGTTRAWINEYVIADAIINPAAVVLADGTTASLNGSARTSFVRAAAQAGALSTSGLYSLGVPQIF